MLARIGFRKINYMLAIALCVVLMAALSSCAQVAGAQSGPASDSSDAPREDTKFSFYTPPQDTTPYPIVAGDEVKNVILLIGDGMGFGQVALARMTAAGMNGKLHMEQLTITGLMTTHPANEVVTDSAAAATAMACGIKTNNGVVGMDPDGKEYLTILEGARQKGMSTGLVATSTITHATPACFGAHVRDRDNEVDIAEQLLENKVNVLLGGGRMFFLPEDRDGQREDGRNLIEEARQVGYSYVESGQELEDVQGPYLLGLFHDEGLTTREPEPTLAELAGKALEVVSKSENGFFLMVEGSQIDWACHDNDKDNTIKQTLRFDEAVKVAMDFAIENRETLVIVTGDHETGGLIAGTEKGDSGIRCSWSTEGHTGMPLPVYSFGPGAMHFVGVYDNTELSKKMANLLRIEPFPRAIE
jgi:alkaline phosphatase